MPIEVKNFNYKITLVLLFFILNSYLVLSFKLPIFLLKANLLLFLFTITLFYIKYLKYNFSLKLYFLLIILLCLGTAATNWDTRSIYLFHTKRIFFDESIYSVVDNYASFSHNDYPLLVPAFSSSFAFLVGYWHEIFPKSAFTLMLLPPLIFLSSYLNMKKYLIFLSIVIFFLGQQLFNGAVDGIVSLYFIVCCFCFYQIFISSEQNLINLAPLLAENPSFQGGYYLSVSNGSCSQDTLITINQGEEIRWINDGGLHDVNGEINSLTNMPFDNPETFNSPSTSIVGDEIYRHTFNAPGFYNYDCSVGGHALNGMTATITVVAVD